MSIEQRKQWQRLYSFAINGNPPWKKDFEKWSADYGKLMQKKLSLLEKWSKEGEPESRFIINDDDLPTETCTCNYIVGNSDA